MARQGVVDGAPPSNRTKNKLLVLLHGVFRRAQKVYGLAASPVAGIERATLEPRYPGVQRRGGVRPRARG